MTAQTEPNKSHKIISLLRKYIDKSTVRNVFYIISAILLFMSGVIVYGIILNIREVSLEDAMMEKEITEITNPNILIDRETYSLKLFDDTVFIKTYRVSFGRNVHHEKRVAGDEATPVGEYKICSIYNPHEFTLYFRLNYPNLEDASNALRKGWISQKDFNQIKFEFYYEGCTKNNKVLGGDIGIHGIGRLNFIFKNLPFVYNWTNGSIAMSDEDILELYSVVKEGTKVVIR